MLIKCFQHDKQSLSYFGVEKIRDIKTCKRAAQCTKAPTYTGSRKGSHHLVYCMQPYLVFYTRGLEK